MGDELVAISMSSGSCRCGGNFDVSSSNAEAVDRVALFFWADHLRATPATVRFLSLEPLLGALPSLDLTGIDWVIVGAESGRGARPMDLGWVREIRDQCFERLIPFFFKQSATPGGRKIPTPELDGRTWTQIPRRAGRGGVS